MYTIVLFTVPKDRYIIYIPVEFVTLKDGSEGLIVKEYYGTKYKFLDPSDAIDVTDDIITDGITAKSIIITKSNKSFTLKRITFGSQMS